jgi:hypothetical protein
VQLTAVCALLALFLGAGTAADQPARVSFKRGASSATLTGTVRGYEMKEYLLNVRRGQRLSARLRSRNRFLYFNLAKPGAGVLELTPRPLEVTEWSGAAPYSGDVLIQVFLVRSEARRKRRAPFSLDVAVTGAPG